MATPPKICSFESRRADEMARLIEKMGGLPTVAPSMQEVPLEENRDVYDFTEKLIAGHVDSTVFMTGVGAKAMMDVVETKFDRAGFLQALRKTNIIVRGPKPAVVLKDWDVPVAGRAAAPNTWRELLQAIDDLKLKLSGQAIAVQEYGIANNEFYDELKTRGATVIPVTVYRWTLPDDTAPLESAIQATIDGKFDAVMFTSANQVRNVLEVAGRLNQRTQWLAATKNCVVASIGPTCSETMKQLGLQIDFEASPPKMGPLVRGTIETISER